MTAPRTVMVVLLVREIVNINIKATNFMLRIFRAIPFVSSTFNLFVESGSKTMEVSRAPVITTKVPRDLVIMAGVLKVLRMTTRVLRDPFRAKTKASQIFH